MKTPCSTPKSTAKLLMHAILVFNFILIPLIYASSDEFKITSNSSQFLPLSTTFSFSSLHNLDQHTLIPTLTSSGESIYGKEWKERQTVVINGQISGTKELKRIKSKNYKVQKKHASTKVESNPQQTEWVHCSIDDIDKIYRNKVKELIADIFDGGNRGKPEILHQFRKKASRKINDEHRLVYDFDRSHNKLQIFSCSKHYENLNNKKNKK